MKNDHFVWLTVFDDKLFDPQKYLYHYTDINKATKIIYNGTLKFSKISKTNDTLESKPRIGDDTSYSECIEQFKELNRNYVQLLCFATDSNVNTQDFNFEITERIKYTDFSGRGFALPRMWAQYANNNSGVCLIFDKEILTNNIIKQLGTNFINGEPIRYVSQFEEYPFRTQSDQIISILLNDVKELKGFPITAHFLKSHLEFVKYNYFSKLDDWKSEREFRFLAYGNEEYFINNILNSLVGVVVGEKIEESDLEIIKLFADKYTDIKKVSFTFNGCKLVNIN